MRAFNASYSSALTAGVRRRGVEPVGAPPVDADCLGLVDRADDQPELDGQELDVRQRDFDVARDDQTLIEDLVEDVDKALRLSLLDRHAREQ